MRTFYTVIHVNKSLLQSINSLNIIFYDKRSTPALYMVRKTNKQTNKQTPKQQQQTNKNKTKTKIQKRKKKNKTKQNKTKTKQKEPGTLRGAEWVYGLSCFPLF